MFFSVGQSTGAPKCPFPFDKTVVPGIDLLYPAYKNNDQTTGGLSLVCATGMYRFIGHVEVPKVQTRIVVKFIQDSLGLPYRGEI